MPKNTFFRELKRRNVYKVALTYSVVAWLLLQIVSVISPMIEAPEWIGKAVLILLLVGFPIALLLAWAFEMNPQGIIRTTSVEAKENPLPDHKKKPLTSNLLIGFLLLVIASQFVYNRFWDGGEVDTAKLEKSIAVLPFKNMSENRANQHFCDGMMDAILNHLSKIPDLLVISRTSVEQYRENLPLLKKIAEDLNVNYIVEGSVQRIDDKAVIMAQLIYAPTDKHLWSQDYNRNLTDVFAVQAEVTVSIAKELHDTISPELKIRIEDKPTNEIEAYDLYMRGRNYHLDYQWTFNTPDLDNAERLFLEAVQIDSTFALAYVGLGLVNSNRRGIPFLDESINESVYMDKAGEYAGKALMLNPELAEAYYLRGLYFESVGLIEKSIADQNTAISLNSNLAEAYLALGQLYFYSRSTNDIPDAVISLKKALLLERSDLQKPLILHALATAYLNLSAFDKAEEYLKEAIRIQPDYINAYVGLWWLSSVQGKFEESISYCESVCQINDHLCNALLSDSYTWTKEFDKALEYKEKYESKQKIRETINRHNDANLIYIHWQLGNKEKATQLLEETVTYWNDRNSNWSPLRIGEAYAAIGDVENALTYLRPSTIYGSYANFMTNCPYFESLWDNEEFQKMIMASVEKTRRVREEVFAMEGAGEL